MDWYWHGVRLASAILDDSEIEDGEPPRVTSTIYAESLASFAQSGSEDGALVNGAMVGLSISLGHRARTAARFGHLTEEERALAERTWAKLPSWDDVKKSLLPRLDAREPSERVDRGGLPGEDSVG